MRAGPEPRVEEGDRRIEELARIAKELADYGFYVGGELLPDENTVIPNRQSENRTPPGAAEDGPRFTVLP